MAGKGSDATGATMLGQQTGLPASPEEAVLERVPNPHNGADYVARFAVPDPSGIKNSCRLSQSDCAGQ